MRMSHCPVPYFYENVKGIIDKNKNIPEEYVLAYGQ